MQLILSGNPNLDSIRSVVYFANEEFEKSIKKVHFLDNEESLRNEEGESIEAERNEFVRECIPDVRVTSTLISRSNMHLKIPQILSKELEVYDRDDIVVDLTNGTKSISSVLYASASLSKIPNLFFLSITPDKRSDPPQSLDDENYDVEDLPALENIGEIGKYSYFEIIYYLERTVELTSEIDRTSLTDDYLKRGMEAELQRGVRNYFREEYAQCIQKIGQVMEALSAELADGIRNKAQGAIQNGADTGFYSTNSWLRSNFCQELRGKLKDDTELEGYEDDLSDLANVDKILETIRVYRNMSSHGTNLLRGEEEAKLIMSNSMYVLKAIKKSGIFQ